MMDFSDALFLSGLAHSDGTKTWAAIQAFIPAVLQESFLCSRVMSALDGYGKRAPEGSRDCPPEEAVFAVVGALLHLGKPLSALNELVRYLAGGRPGEIDGLKVSQLIEPRTSTGCWSILLHPQENLAPGKTGAFDESILLDQALVKEMHTCLQALVEGRPPADPLWMVSSTDLNLDFQKALQFLKMDNVGLVRYSWRHAAASHDLLSKNRTQEEVKARYRWQSDTSMRRYTKAARVEYFARRLPPQVLEFGALVRTSCANIFRGQELPPLPH